MTGEVGGGERVRSQYENYQKIIDHLAGLIDRVSKLDPVTLKANGMTVVAGDDEQVASMGPELACVDRRGKFMYYAQLIGASTSDIDGSGSAVYMSVYQKTEGDYQVVKEVRIGTSGEGAVSDFTGEGAGRIETGYQEVAREANQVLGFFETAISKAEQGGKQRGGRLAGLLEKWRRLKDQALDGIEAVMKELDS